MVETQEDTAALVAQIEALGDKLAAARASVSRRFIGQDRVVDLVLSTLLSPLEPLGTLVRACSRARASWALALSSLPS